MRCATSSSNRNRCRPLAASLFVALALSVITIGAGPAEAFTDVAPGAFYETPVAWLVNLGITTGTSSTTFSPDEPVTRGQMAAFLWRYAGQPGGFTHNFLDVPSTAYYNPAVGWLAAKGITTGVGPGRYGPDEYVTRGQMAAFLHRFAGLPASSGNPFGDVPAGAYYAAAVGWLAATNITTGVGPGRYGPDEVVTRGQMAAFLYRLRNHVTPAPKSIYIVNVAPTSGNPGEGSVTVNGVAYGDAVSWSHFSSSTERSYEYDVPVGMNSFTADLALTDDSLSGASLNFEVWVDGQLVGESMSAFNDDLKTLTVDVRDALRVVIRTEQIGYLTAYPAWIGARFSTGTVTPRPTSPRYTWLRWLTPVSGNPGEGTIIERGMPGLRAVYWSHFSSSTERSYEYDVPVGMNSFTAELALTDSSATGSQFNFEVWVDDQLVAEKMQAFGAARGSLTVDVSGASRIRLRTEQIAYVTGYPAWIDPRFSTAAVSPRPTTPQYTWLRWMTPVTGNPVEGTVHVGGVPKVRSMWWSHFSGTATVAYEFDVPVGTTRFVGSIGLTDSSTTGAGIRFLVITPGGTVLDTTLGNGATQDFDVAVTGGTRITLQTDQVNSITAYPAWLGARFERP